MSIVFTARVMSILLCLVFSVAAFAQPSKGKNVPFPRNEYTTSRPKLVFTTLPAKGISEFCRRILREAYGRIGYDISIKCLPGKRALVVADSGMVDGEAARLTIIEKTNHNLIRVPTSIFSSVVVALVKSDKIDVSEGWESLRSYKTGILLGYKYAEMKTCDMDRVLVPTYDQLIGLLYSGRVDVVIISLFDGLMAVKDLKLKGISALSPQIEGLPIYHYLHKKNADLVPKIDKVFREMLAEGRVQEIRKKMEMELRCRRPEVKVN